MDLTVALLEFIRNRNRRGKMRPKTITRPLVRDIVRESVWERRLPEAECRLRLFDTLVHAIAANSCDGPVVCKFAIDHLKEELLARPKDITPPAPPKKAPNRKDA
jgi:hypothetical protein